MNFVDWLYESLEYIKSSPKDEAINNFENLANTDWFFVIRNGVVNVSGIISGVITVFAITNFAYLLNNGILRFEDRINGPVL